MSEVYEVDYKEREKQKELHQGQDTTEACVKDMQHNRKKAFLELASGPRDSRFWRTEVRMKSLQESVGVKQNMKASFAVCLRR